MSLKSSNQTKKNKKSLKTKKTEKKRVYPILDVCSVQLNTAEAGSLVLNTVSETQLT